jgi:hypothetical protein
MAFPDFVDSRFSGFRKIVCLEGKLGRRHVLKVMAQDGDLSSVTVTGIVELADHTPVKIDRDSRPE